MLESVPLPALSTAPWSFVRFQSAGGTCQKGDSPAGAIKDSFLCAITMPNR
jgi:hypothetical protein